MPNNQEELEILAAIDQLIDRLHPVAQLYIFALQGEGEESDDISSLNSFGGDITVVAQSLVVLLQKNPLLMRALMYTFYSFDAAGGEGSIMKGSEDLTDEVNQLKEP